MAWNRRLVNASACRNEFKHILDHEYAKQFFPVHLSPTDRYNVEQLCEYFAGCLLMPRKWLRTACADGVGDVVALANRFEVSPRAMQVRLTQLGLLRTYGRHSQMDNVYLRSSTASQLGQAA